MGRILDLLLVCRFNQEHANEPTPHEHTVKRINPETGVDVSEEYRERVLRSFEREVRAKLRVFFCFLLVQTDHSQTRRCAGRWAVPPLWCIPRTL